MDSDLEIRINHLQRILSSVWFRNNDIAVVSG